MDPDESTPDLAALLTAKRTQLGVSQRHLAESASVPSSLVCRVERGQDARLSTWRRLFEGLGCELRFTAQETSEDAACLFADEAEQRRERQVEGLCAGKRRFWR